MVEADRITPNPHAQVPGAPLKNLSDHDRLTADFLAWIGTHADEGTEQVLRSTLTIATEADIASIRETMQNADPDNRAAWLIGALQTARRERLDQREGGTQGDLLRLCDQLEQHGRSFLANVATLRQMIADLDLPDHHRRHILCPTCGVRVKTERALAFHLQNVHNGPAVPLTPEEAAA